MNKEECKKILQDATKEDVISSQQYLTLLEMFESMPQSNKVFNFSNILFYFGGFLAISAISIFMSLSYIKFNDVGLFFSSLVVFIGALRLTHNYIKKTQLIPAGIVATFAVALVPLIVYCIFSFAGLIFSDFQEYHRAIKWHWVMIEIITLSVAAIMLYVYRLPFMMFAVTVTLWYLSMDMSVMIFGDDYWSYDLRRKISMMFGVFLIGMAVYIDVRSQRRDDYAFWPYLFGVTCFWVALTMMTERAVGPLTLYFILNVAFFVLGALLKRKIFVVCAAFGSMYYLGYLSNKVFDDTIIFTLVLSILGMILIKLGMLWQANHVAIENRIRAKLPSSVTQYLDVISR